MALVLGNKTTSNANPGGSSQTLSVNCSSGSDRGLLVSVTMSNTVNFSSATYNGVSMTLVRNQNMGTLSQRQALFWLADPSTGANNLVVNFSGSQWNSTSIMAQSFTGADATIGNDAGNGLVTSPHSQTLTVSANSVIYLTGVSVAGQSFGYIIDGSTRTNDFAHNTNRQVEGAFSATGLSAGSITCITKADSGSVTNVRVEIKEVAAAVPDITVTPGALSGFTYAEGTGPSSAQSYTWSITDATNDVVATAPTNYELATTEFGTYGPTITAGGPPTGPYTHWARLKAGLPEATYNLEDITLTSTGAVTETVTLNGAVTTIPSISTSVSVINGFTYAEGSGPSPEQTFTVSGENLTDVVTLDASTNYEISTTSGSGFGAQVILADSGGDLVGEPVTIYVRLKAGLVENTYNSENITLSTPGPTSSFVTLNGSVTAPAGTRRRIIIC